jgi:hypothetical protein
MRIIAESVEDLFFRKLGGFAYKQMLLKKGLTNEEIREKLEKLLKEDEDKVLRWAGVAEHELGLWKGPLLALGALRMLVHREDAFDPVELGEDPNDRKVPEIVSYGEPDPDEEDMPF